METQQTQYSSILFVQLLQDCVIATIEVLAQIDLYSALYQNERDCSEVGAWSHVSNTFRVACDTWCKMKQHGATCFYHNTGTVALECDSQEPCLL